MVCVLFELSVAKATPVKLVVMDGVVIGATHCAYDDCTQDLARLRGGVFCMYHELLCDNLCHMCDCVTTQRYHLLKHVHNTKITGTNMLYDMDNNHYLEFTEW